MGYDMEISGQLTIPKGKREDALAAILKAHDEDPFWSNPSFQEKRDGGEPVTFEEVFGEVMARNGLGDDWLTVGPNDWLGEDELEFQGEVRAGWGEDQVMHAVAPFVTEGEVRWEGEDGERGRYLFAHGHVEEQSGALIFGLSAQLETKLQNEVDRDTAAMLEQQSKEVATDA